MKIKAPPGLLLIDILTILLVISILEINSVVIRIVLGIPFLLFFPGYTLISALFSDEKDSMGSIERIALSVILSVIITVLIGLGLNYTPWGIRLEPAMYSISAFILIVSVIALLRHRGKGQKFIPISKIRFHISIWEGNSIDKVVSIILVIALAGSIVVLGYIAAKPEVGEQFSEFYVIGNGGMADEYPSDFIINQSAVVQVSYDKGISFINDNKGKVILGIINHEKQQTVFAVSLKIDGQTVSINDNGQSTDMLNNIKLQPGEKWESEIGFAPQNKGDNQKVEFLLYKNSTSAIDNTLYLWINVIEKQ